ncbi:MAG: RNase adapter RapZ [Coriobacteriaceae bacterium]|nr:RNase adapter RapZ [Coriobacteriaceae bacterium]MDY3799691.1 RNase adapter RapZ [Eggerthellaceae bacterium]MDY4987466.1 RNase adapter RapZ [Eggerthellaceae bacterium]
MTDLAIITGMSGAGRTEAMHTFEDLGFFCIDNLPPSLLLSLVDSQDIPESEGELRRLAVVCDSRNFSTLGDLNNVLLQLKDRGIAYRIVFLDASDEELLARYKATRRRHPLSIGTQMTVSQAIAKERKMLAKLRNAADHIIDTTDRKPIALRQTIQDLFSGKTAQEGLDVYVYSFGFKHGAALDADIVIDVRFLPNPYYDPEMRHLTGLDPKVSDFVISRSETQEFLSCWQQLLQCVMPGYVNEGKTNLIIAVGCTGGQHRSVAIAVETGKFLRELGYCVTTTHRDLSRADTKRKDA